MLRIKDMNSNNVIRQGDSQPREYQLDTGNLNLNLTNKSATIRLMTADFQGIGYETTATVSSENKITFSIDDVIPDSQYHLEITVDDYVFPSRALDGQFNVDPSSHGQEASIIQIIGKDEIVRDVKEQVKVELEPFLGGIEQVDLTNYATKVYVDTAVSNVQAPDLSDYVLSSRVLTDVPANAKFTDTVYTHPSSHPASMITETNTKRFVSDTQISTWDAKPSNLDTITNKRTSQQVEVWIGTEAQYDAIGTKSADTLYFKT